jgi:hypothetical protein
MGKQSALALIERQYSLYQFLGLYSVNKFLWPALKPAIKQFDPEHDEGAYFIGLLTEIYGDLSLEPVILFWGCPSFWTFLAAFF